MRGRRPPLRECIDCRGQVRAWSRHARCKECERALARSVSPHVQPVKPPTHDGIPF